MTEYHDGMRVEKEKNSAIPPESGAAYADAFTKGEWRSAAEMQQLDLGESINVVAGPIDAPVVIATVMNFDDFPCLEENVAEDMDIEAQANARLIAAAPDLLTILREALKTVDDDPERYEVYGWCNECTQGSTPMTFDRGLCWVHKARKLLGDAQ